MLGAGEDGAECVGKKGCYLLSPEMGDKSTAQNPVYQYDQSGSLRAIRSGDKAVSKQDMRTIQYTDVRWRTRPIASVWTMPMTTLGMKRIDVSTADSPCTSWKLKDVLATNSIFQDMW
jgi:hypothetical protein